jgi:hypothetical protein
MYKKVSKIGIFLTALYWLYVIGLFIYAYTCSDWFCQLKIFYATFPWEIPGEAASDEFWLLFIPLFLLNSAILYILGHIVKIILKKIKISDSN